MLGKVPLIQMDDYQLQQMQQGLNERVNQLSAVPFTDGRLIESVELTAAAPVLIQHKLGRKYKGYIPTKVMGPAIFFDSTSRDEEFFLELTTDTDVTLDLWVF